MNKADMPLLSAADLGRFIVQKKVVHAYEQQTPWHTLRPPVA